MRLNAWDLFYIPIVMLTFSAVMDLWLWSFIEYTIPSWTVSGFSAAMILMMALLREGLERTSNLPRARSSKSAQAEGVKLNAWQRLVLRVNGRVFIGYETRPVWSGFLPFYAFRCDRHGIVKDYFHGFPGEQYLLCPDCLNEGKANITRGRTRGARFVIWCDFGDCRRAATVWVSCDGVKRPYCDLHREDHSIHCGAHKYEAEIEGDYIRCNAVKSFGPVDPKAGDKKRVEAHG